MSLTQLQWADAWGQVYVIHYEKGRSLPPRRPAKARADSGGCTMAPVLLLKSEGRTLEVCHEDKGRRSGFLRGCSDDGGSATGGSLCQCEHFVFSSGARAVRAVGLHTGVRRGLVSDGGPRGMGAVR